MKERKTRATGNESRKELTMTCANTTCVMNTLELFHNPDNNQLHFGDVVILMQSHEILFDGGISMT